ncbi:OmpA family protein [Sabulicella rubraurantiaca]|uniref:OmpA family protein n=1 Tax=Sabulicella rubraurantiaca TaxID=2811429 RepID=UPI001A95B9A3|nr:OmpA family protein [Sabulicella rubraurantiaca]
MKNWKGLLLATVAVGGLPLAAHAQTGQDRGFLGAWTPTATRNVVSGLYIGGALGANWMEQQGLSAGSISGVSPFQSPNGRINYNTGWVGLGSIGWGLGNGLRFELEGNYRENEVDSVKGFGFQTGFNRAGGFQRTYGIMANVFYDFNIPAFPWVTPYVGAGIGGAWQEMRNVRFVNPAQGNRAVNINGSSSNFAYQAMGGVAFNILSVPGLATTLEYRYFATLENDFGAVGRGGPPFGNAGGRIETDNHNHSVLVGLRYAFNQPRPAPVAAVAPAPAPVPAPARTYLVFFDWDRADLTDRARQIISDAAQNSRRVQSTRIEVSGHADRSGTPQYNQRLSERRAEAVAAELVRNGVSRGEITVQAFGESRPLVPTADGVREPQNRRVEIVLR